MTKALNFPCLRIPEAGSPSCVNTTLQESLK